MTGVPHVTSGGQRTSLTEASLSHCFRRDREERERETRNGVCKKAAPKGHEQSVPVRTQLAAPAARLSAGQNSMQGSAWRRYRNRHGPGHHGRRRLQDWCLLIAPATRQPLYLTDQKYLRDEYGRRTRQIGSRGRALPPKRQHGDCF